MTHTAVFTAIGISFELTDGPDSTPSIADSPFREIRPHVFGQTIEHI